MIIDSPFSLNNEKKEKLEDFPEIENIKFLFTKIIAELNNNFQLKSKLFSIQGFFPDILFLKLDFFSKKNIATKDFLHYLEKHNYKFNDEMVRRFIKQYDKHGNFNLIYEDFLKMISPLDTDKIIKDVNNDYKNIDEFFCTILINELNLIGIIGEIALEIRKNDNIDIYNIFKEISKNQNIINKELLFDFLDGKFTDTEINNLIYYIDSNNDGLISFDEFHDLLMPIESDFEMEEINDNNINEYKLFNQPHSINRNNYIINNDINNYNFGYNNYNDRIISNDYYHYLLDNKNKYLKVDPNQEFDEQKNINNNIIFNDININHKKNNINEKYDDINEIPEEENISNEKNYQENNNKKDYDRKIKNDLCLNRYLDKDIIGDVNYGSFINKTTKNIFPKIFNEEKVDVPTRTDKSFSKNNCINNNLDDEDDFIIHNNNNKIKTNINYPENNNNTYDLDNNNIITNKEEELDNYTQNDIKYTNPPPDENGYEKNLNYPKEEINNNNNNHNQFQEDNNLYEKNIILQKFPITFGNNHETNNTYNNKLQFLNEINNNDIMNNDENVLTNDLNDSDSQKLCVDTDKNDNNYKDEIKFMKEYFNNNNLNDINYQDIHKTINERNNINLNKELCKDNTNPNFDSSPPKTFSYPIEEKENIKIHHNNSNIKNNNNIHHDSKKHKDKKCSNIIEAINNFLEYINLICLNENRIEHIKQNLVLREDLSLKELFFLFDLDQNNCISIKNFQLICKNIFKLFPTLSQVKLVFKRYKKKALEKQEESQENLTLNSDEFLKMMSPKKIEYINLVNTKNTLDTTNMKLSVKSKKILNELIKCLLQKESDYYKIRSKFDKDSLKLLWKEITKNAKNQDKINKKQLHSFLEKYGYFMEEKQMSNIFFIFDKEQKFIIKDSNFFEEMYNI